MTQVDANEARGCAFCPHLERVQGSCSHEFNQMLIQYMEDNPESLCPIFEDIRMREMTALVREMGLG